MVVVALGLDGFDGGGETREANGLVAVGVAVMEEGGTAGLRVKGMSVRCRGMQSGGSAPCACGGGRGIELRVVERREGGIRRRKWRRWLQLGSFVVVGVVRGRHGDVRVNKHAD